MDNATTVPPRRLNAVRHGLRSGAPVVAYYETMDDWLAFHDELVESMHPRGAAQYALASLLASNVWRSRRIAAAEAWMIGRDREGDLKEEESRLDWVHGLNAIGSALYRPKQKDLVPREVPERLVPNADGLNALLRAGSHLGRERTRLLRDFRLLREFDAQKAQPADARDDEKTFLPNEAAISSAHA